MISINTADIKKLDVRVFKCAKEGSVNVISTHKAWKCKTIFYKKKTVSDVVYKFTSRVVLNKHFKCLNVSIGTTPEV